MKNTWCFDKELLRDFRIWQLIVSIKLFISSLYTLSFRSYGQLFIGPRASRGRRLDFSDPLRIWRNAEDITGQ